ncbi:MAG TPA: lysylphosphatidylglycerol synthase transmembrane domain-containing protein [Solirubrobacteraceae bacterium]|nr:lysylphosphatidylglycerol synthase transmembrane domain-containing protein [Solirubrobacteraceae bacterium]
MASHVEDPPRVARDDLDGPEQLSAHKVRSRLLVVIALVAVVVAVVVLLPGLGELRTRLEHASVGWLFVGIGLKVLSGFGYIAVFRMVFCRRMSWRVSYQVGMSELGANALFPTGGAGGLALGAWALKRGGMPAEDIARRTVAFFLLTSVPNVLGVIVIGLLLATGAVGGESNLLLTALPAAIAAGAVVLALQAGRIARRWGRRLERRGRELSRRKQLLMKALTALGEGVQGAVALLREGNVVLIAGLVAYLAFDVMIVWATFHALGPTPPLAILWMAYLIGELGGLIPIPGGIGGVDAGLVGTLALYDVSLASATGAVLAYRAIALWVPAVLGGIAFVFLRRTLRDEAQEIALCAPQQEIEVIGLGRVTLHGDA